MKATVGKWEVETLNGEDQYLFVNRRDKPGEIRIKADNEGFVVDIITEGGEVETSTYSFYTELKMEED
jgi:hypothetical protein